MDKIIVYGLNEDGRKKQIQDEFSEIHIDYKKRYHGEYLGEFNGEEFKQENSIVEGAKRFQYLHLHDKWGLRLHTPRRFNENIMEKIKRQYIYSYGNNSQISMF